MDRGQADILFLLSTLGHSDLLLLLEATLILYGKSEH